MTKTFLIDTNCFTDDNLFTHYFKIIPSDRQKKINRLIPLNAKRLSLGAGVAMSMALNDFGLYGQGAEIQYNENGKPFLVNSGFHVSLSHSGHYAAAVISTCPVGIDIEEIKPIEDGVIKRVTTKSEQTQIKNLRDFYRLWTAKECILKITGEGLSGGMENIDLCLSKDKIYILTAPISNDYCFKEYVLPDFCLTVCGNEGNFAPLIEEITL